jgi:hypothetical protein
VRDFSASDDSVPAHLRGKYVAFDTSATGTVTKGQQHLKDLAEAGLTHVHLLPSYDFGSVPEKAEDQLDVAMDLSQFAPGVLAGYATQPFMILRFVACILTLRFIACVPASISFVQSDVYVACHVLQSIPCLQVIGSTSPLPSAQLRHSSRFERTF